MSHIACSSNNSFAIDNSGNLYTWGSNESGLLGFENDKEVITPRLLEVKNGNDEYTAERVFAGPFHVAVIGNRKNQLRKRFSELQKELEFAQEYFKALLDWYKDAIRDINSAQFMIHLLIRHKSNSQDIKYEDFKKLFLTPFCEYLKLNKMNFFNITETYNELLYKTFQFTKNRPFFKASLLDELCKTKDQKLKALYDYAKECFDHFKEFPEDFHHFIRIVFKYKSTIGYYELEELFKYCPKEVPDTILNKIINALAIPNSKDMNFIEANILADLIIGEDTGNNCLLTWGVNAKGRLGYKDVEKNSTNVNADENEQIQYRPKAVYFRKNDRIIQVACGYYHTLCLTDTGKVFAWGSSKYGCLGKYMNTDQYYPVEIEDDSEKQPFRNIVQIAAGQFMSFALNDKGKVYSWGLGNKGRLGHGDENSVETPKEIKFFSNNDIFIEQISCGDLHCGVITRNKELYTWGNGAFGKLGHCNFDHVLKPKIVSYFSSQKVRSVYCGSYNTMAITTDSRIFVWGKNSHGMLGVPQFDGQNVLYPAEILYQKFDESLTGSEIGLGTMHSLLLCQNGSLLSCGNSVNGVLGIENVHDKINFLMKIDGITFYKTDNKELMKEIPLFQIYKDNFSLEQKKKQEKATEIIYLDCSTYNSAFITNTGELYMAGSKKLFPKRLSEEGIIIEEPEDNTIYPLYRVTCFREKVNYISLGKFHAICIADCKAYAWGLNNYGVCGISGKSLEDELKVPTLIEAIKSPSKMCAVSDTHSMVLTVNGEIYAFGSNMYGKLGVCDLKKYFAIGGSPMELEPMLVKNVSDVKYIDCSNYHSACIVKVAYETKTNLALFTWGNGLDGKLGHGNSHDYYEPKKVEMFATKTEEHDLINIIKVALGNDFSIAIDEKGKLWGWGKRAYLPGIREDKEGREEIPINLQKKSNFKFIAVKNNLACAINNSGEMFCWGEMITEKGTVITSYGTYTHEKMVFASPGYNHCASIDLNHFPYSWGNNIYLKGGHEDTEPKENPKRIESIFKLLNENEQKQNEKHSAKDEPINFNQEPNKEEMARIEGRDLTQLKLLDESSECQNLGLMSRDVKMNDNFFDTINKFFKALREIEEKKCRLLVDTEDVVITNVNKSGIKSKNQYKSEIPLIYSKNFQFYETFIQLLQCHPCYFRHLFKANSNVPSLMKVIHLIFGKNYIILRNKRILGALTGIWNAIFDLTVIDAGFDLTSSLIYSIYKLIFNITEENVKLSNELVSLGFIVLFTKIIDKEYININKEVDKIITKVKTFDANTRAKIIEEIKKALKKYISEIFSDLEGNKNLSYSVTWIISQIVKKSHKLKLSKKKTYLFVNTFIFNPCLELIEKIISSEKKQEEFDNLSSSIPSFLLSTYCQKNFTQLVNDFKAKGNESTNCFKVICDSKSEALRFICDIFKELANSEEPIEKVMDILEKFEFDFTSNIIKEQVKYLSEFGNDRITVPFTIKELIELQQSFEQIERDLEKNDPLKSILKELKDFADDKLDSTSSANNIVVNISFSPFFFYYKMNEQECEMVKCSKCQLPVPSLFLTPEERDICKYGPSWTCKNNKCGKSMETKSGRTSIECKYCGKIKEKEQLLNDAFFFKRFSILNENELADKLEKTFLIVRPLYAGDDIAKEANTELNRLQDSKEKTKETKKIDILKEFNKYLSHEKDKRQENAKVILEETRKIVEDNIANRAKHVEYLKTIEDLINFISEYIDEAKINYSSFEGAIKLYKKNIQKGYVSKFFVVYNKIVPLIVSEKKSMKKKKSKIYLVKDLIEKKVINQILVNNPQLVQKSYLELEKNKEGLHIKWSYKENEKKYVICGTTKHDFKLDQISVSNERILDLRHIATHNQVIQLGDISFNTFYLDKLMNNLLNEQ